MIPTYMVVLFIILIMGIIIAASFLVYILFFKKVQVVCFGANGAPNEIKKAKKLKNRLYINSRINIAIMNNYVRVGKSYIYFAYKVDEMTYLPFNLSQSAETAKVQDFNIEKDLIEKKIQEIAKIKTSKEVMYFEKKIEKCNMKLEDLENIKLTHEENIKFGDTKSLFVNRKKYIKILEKKIALIHTNIKKYNNKIALILEKEKRKYSNVKSDNTSERRFFVLPQLTIDYEWNSIVADAYDEGSKRFKFGLEKFAPFLTIGFVALFCVIMVLGVSKFATEIEPVEMEALQTCAKTFKDVAPYYAEGSKSNAELAKTLKPGNQNSGVPK